MTQPETLAADLQRYLGQNALVRDVTNLSMGWESDVYGFVLENAATGHAEARALRLYFGAHGAYTAGREAAALRLLRRAGYPVPEVYVVESGAAALGRPFMIMQRMPGELLWAPMLQPGAPQAEQHMAHFCRLLVQLHTLNWAALPAAERALLPQRDVAGQLAYLGGIARRYPLPGIDDGMVWLVARQDAVAAAPLALIHWDLHPANVLFAPPDRYTVIDWTQAEICDPRFDLAWTLVLVGSQASWDAAGRIQASYAAQGGATTADLDYFVAAACLKRLVSVLISLSHGAETLGMRPSAEATMAQHLDRIAQVYRRWLEITGLRLAEAERRLASHL
ncbi:MAG: phosphotransferase [Caldilineaceae bacterium]|nr:phosphotransferase [Caldilineaceae bacterium]